jgi:SAM-dependent methyltransferase
MDDSVSYDRIAHVYDATRALPKTVQRKLTDALVAEFASVGAQHVLEVGVGTGRIARPLAERGVRVCGVDIGSRMLWTLRRQQAQDVAIDHVLGDATQLPLATASFRGVLVYHLWHLVSSSESAVREIRRVLAPGGVVISGYERYCGVSPWDACTAKLKEVAATRGFVPRPRPGPYSETIGDALRALGGSSRLRGYAKGRETHTPEEVLDRIRERIYYTWLWDMRDDLFADCLAEFELWYRRHYGDMGRELVQPVSYEIEVWSFT